MGRTWTSDDAGKRVAEVKTRLTEEAHEDLVAVARLEGYATPSEWLRDVVMHRLYGAVPRDTIVQRAIDGEGRQSARPPGERLRLCRAVDAALHVRAVH